MKMNPIALYTFPALLVAAPVALADISLGAPAAAEPQRSVYHTDLLASNAVLATFKELRSIPVVRLDAAPETEEVAVFEVKRNLAHRRYDRMGDGELKQGKLFSVSLAADVPGQDASLGNTLRELKAGEEALLNIDHIYVFREEGNENVHACTRFVKIQPGVAPGAPHTAAQQPNALQPRPDRAVLPISSNTREVFTRVTIEPDGNGGMRQMKITEIREVSDDGKTTVRKFINNVEVDPQTDQPLPIPAAEPVTPEPAAPQPAAAAEPAPEQPGEQPAPGDTF